jgi:hypothetical protein
MCRQYIGPPRAKQRAQDDMFFAFIGEEHYQFGYRCEDYDVGFNGEAHVYWHC